MLESLLGVLAVVGGLPAAADPIIGATLAGAQATAFYTDYKFDEVARHTDSAGQVWIQFRPATTYRAQVKLWLRLSPAGIVDQATLDLSRGLVEPEATKAVARAMTNIFLLAAIPAADLPAVEPIAKTIWLDRDPRRFDPSVAGAVKAAGGKYTGRQLEKSGAIVTARDDAVGMRFGKALAAIVGI